MFWSISSSVKLQNSTTKSAYFQQKTGEKCLPWCLTSGTTEELCRRNKELSFCVCINTKSRFETDLKTAQLLSAHTAHLARTSATVSASPSPFLKVSSSTGPCCAGALLNASWHHGAPRSQSKPKGCAKAVLWRQNNQSENGRREALGEGSRREGWGHPQECVGCTTSVLYEEKASWILLKITARKMYFKCLCMNLPIYHAVCFIGCNISLLTKSFLQLTCIFSASSDKTKGNKIISFPHFFNFVFQKTRSLKGHILIEFLFYPPVVLK